MKYKLLSKDNTEGTVETILHNRGIKNINEYESFNWENLASPLLLGIRPLQFAGSAIKSAIEENQEAVMVVDCDCDGFCSSALLTNYLYQVNPDWVIHRLHHIFHSGKQHGLHDTIGNVIDIHPGLVIIPDAGSNDYNEHKILTDMGCSVVVIDHHLADKISEDAIIINNQLSNYPNKELSGVGVTWQVCRFLNQIFGKEYDILKLLDLVALGMTGDMMSLLSPETKFLIKEGFKKEHIKNPFIHAMINKNEFSLHKPDYYPFNTDFSCTIMGAAFFIVPFVNAVNRSGTIEEKHKLFYSMVEYSAYNVVLSDKRGHKLGETETLLEQVLRMVTNVKNRQTRAEDTGLAKAEEIIKNNNLLNHKVLAIKTKEKDIDPELRGLIANKLMAKYQRPCMVVADTGDSYDGSMRGYTKTGIDDFKKECEKNENYLNYVEGC